MNIWKEVEQDELNIDSERRKLTRENEEKVLETIYCYIKEKSNNYYNGEGMHPGYGIIRDAILSTEGNVKGKIMDISVPFNLKEKHDDFIENLVFFARKYLIENHFSYYTRRDRKIDLNFLNFTNYCKESAYYIKKICDKKRIKNYLLPIYPGYTNKVNLYNRSGFHFANIVFYQNNYYLVDVTYSQFFYIERNCIERIGVVKLSGCTPGKFMTMNEVNKMIAMELLKKGYIELTEDVFKRYLDAFTISYRNGLYYENTGDFTFETNYSLEDYIHFLEGSDNQVNWEGIENLGFQKRPMKKNFTMKKR